MMLNLKNGGKQINMEHLQNSKKRVLLIAPTYMDLYEDIRSTLEQMGFNVTFYPDLRIKGDPYNKVSGVKKHLSIQKFTTKIENIWNEIMINDMYDGVYDYLLVIDGLSVPCSLINRLREKNANLLACNYLYDRVKGVYELERNFPYFDRIFTFDQSDSKEYGLSFLPIYWMPSNERHHIIYNVFGFGAYDSIRLNVFRHIKRIIRGDNFIKVYYSKDKKITMIIKNIVKLLTKKQHIPISDFFSGLITNKTISPNEFRQMILSSNAVIDTNHPYQDGLTARFMWALGAEKKIVTTNSSVRNYSFYSKEQIFIIEDNWSDLSSFLNSHFVMSPEIRNEVLKYRIDNWLHTILS